LTVSTIRPNHLIPKMPEFMGERMKSVLNPPERHMDLEMKSVEISKAIKTENYCAGPLVVYNQ